MTSSADFAALGLAPPLLRALAEAGYKTPTAIQQQAIPVVLQGRDLRAAAQTGTGKTAGFTLPVLQRLTEAGAKGAPPPGQPGRPRCLVLVPTRELAAQVEASVRTYGKYLPVRSLVLFGGVSINPQITALRGCVDILVATPGRLLDHAGQRTVDLSGLEILVLDEADRMLDMGFIRDIRRILALLPQHRQNLLFSATFSDDIRALADGLLRQPVSVEVARRNTTSELVDQLVYRVDKPAKRFLLAHLIRQGNWQQVLVFTRTKHGANRLAEQLDQGGIAALAIHGNKSQNARTRALSAFKDGSLRVLVATDIAARGLDIDQLPHVVNFELPQVPEDYVHRIGRTGRAGSPGSAVSLVDPEEAKLLRDIERLIKQPIACAQVPHFEPPPAQAPVARTDAIPRPTPSAQLPADRARKVAPPAPPSIAAARATPARRPASGSATPASLEAMRPKPAPQRPARVSPRPAQKLLDRRQAPNTNKATATPEASTQTTERKVDRSPRYKAM
jgi:ATP-dependent RNA helicase RhlE